MRARIPQLMQGICAAASSAGRSPSFHPAAVTAAALASCRGRADAGACVVDGMEPRRDEDLVPLVLNMPHDPCERGPAGCRLARRSDAYGLGARAGDDRPALLDAEQWVVGGQRHGQPQALTFRAERVGGAARGVNDALQGTAARRADRGAHEEVHQARVQLPRPAGLLEHAVPHHGHRSPSDIASARLRVAQSAVTPHSATMPAIPSRSGLRSRASRLESGWSGRKTEGLPGDRAPPRHTLVPPVRHVGGRLFQEVLNGQQPGVRPVNGLEPSPDSGPPSPTEGGPGSSAEVRSCAVRRVPAGGRSPPGPVGQTRSQTAVSPGRRPSASSC